MNKRYNIILPLALLAIGCNAGAQGTVYIAKGNGSIPWPPSDIEAMTRLPYGNFHVGLTNLEDGEGIVLADRQDSGEYMRIGPKGDKTVPHASNYEYVVTEDGDVHGTVSRTVSSGFSYATSDFDLWTDRACYRPGETVWIQASKFNQYKGATIRYRRGAEVLKEEPLRQEWWPWNPPSGDFCGYLVDVYRLDDEGREEILGSIGVDVSSDWKRFPRYGYAAWYEPGKEQWVGGDVAFLNRRHINAVQFQDWHWKHHWPYCGDDTYTDIAMRDISLNVVKEFINAQHGYNMKSIFYNLGYGALPSAGAADDGVREDWYYYLDSGRRTKDSHDLPSSWKSSIEFVDPGNIGWQNYICDRNDEVYSNLNFDGFQVDQVGRRGWEGGYVYDYWGNRFDLADHFQPLLKACKQRHPDKSLIMNSVSKYGARQIASSGVVDVCYNEMWASEADMMDLYWAIFDNKQAGGDDMKTVFAAYMNYDFADKNSGKNFNNPGVLLTDACIFALGASHLELGTGGNMLCREYFPATNLKMSDELVESITRYYDFITAYENYLYDTERELSPRITSLSDHQISIWNYQMGPQPRRIVVHGKEAETGALVYHMLNFSSVNNLGWRDINADMSAPEHLSDIKLDIDCDRMVSKAWVATPDSHACVPVELDFTQQGRSVTVTVPSLDYWTMLVLE